MKAFIVSLESFQKGDIPEEVKQYLASLDEEPFIVLDESSKIKTNKPCKESSKSKRTQAILKLNSIGERCILTGTFMSKSPCNAYDQMNFLKPKFFAENMYSFSERYEVKRSLPNVRGARVQISPKDYETIHKRLFANKNNPNFLAGTIDAITRFYGISRDDCYHILKHKDYTPFKHTEELWERIGDVCTKVDRKSDTNILPKVYKSFNVNLTQEQKKLYLQLQNQHCTDRIAVDNGLKLYLRFQDVCNGYEPVETEEIQENGHHKVDLIPLKENPKLEMLQEIVESLGDKQAVIWCSRTRLLNDAETMMRELGYTTAIYDGKIDKNKREEGYLSFAKGETQLIFANPRSAGYGLDGMKNCDYAIYLCNSYSVEERLQSENRIYRGEIKNSKFIFDITCYGTCEKRVTEALKVGQELVDSGTTNTDIFKYYEENA